MIPSALQPAYTEINADTGALPIPLADARALVGLGADTSRDAKLTQALLAAKEQVQAILDAPITANVVNDYYADVSNTFILSHRVGQLDPRAKLFWENRSAFDTISQNAGDLFDFSGPEMRLILRDDIMAWLTYNVSEYPKTRTNPLLITYTTSYTSIPMVGQNSVKLAISELTAAYFLYSPESDAAGFAKRRAMDVLATYRDKFQV